MDKYSNYLNHFIGINILLIALNYMNFMPQPIRHPVFLIILSIVLTFITAKVEEATQKNVTKKKQHYENLDGIRYFCSIVVILVHLRPFLGIIDPLDITLNYVIGRTCVPLFFLITSYLIAKKEKDNPDYIKKYVKSLLPVYLVWSAFYIPILIDFLQPYFPTILGYLSQIPTIFQIPALILAIPLVLIVTLLYSGVYYHLWYFPALFLSLLILRKWKEKHKVSTLIWISLILIILGASETYYGIIPESIKFLFDGYFKIFVTTRNFLFFGLFYVVFGYYLGQKDRKVPKYLTLKTIIWGIVLILEVFFIRSIVRLNSNILLAPIPFVYYFFHLLLYNKPLYKRKRIFNLRNLYKYYYLVHPIIILMFQQIILKWQPDLVSHCFVSSIIVLTLTHIISIILLITKKKFPKLVI